MNNYNVSFFQVVLESGPIGIIVWMTIFILAFAGLILGLISIVTALGINKNKYPIALKLLFCTSVATLLTGAHGTITGYVDSFARLATTCGAAKAAALELCIKYANYNLKFALCAVTAQLILAGISLWIIENRSKNLSFSTLSPLKRIKQAPILNYLLVCVLIPTLLGCCGAFWGIEKIVTLKPDETIPTLLGLDYILLMRICLTSACMGIVLTIILLAKTVINQPKKSVNHR